MERRLWQDKPEYMALVGQTPVKRIRMLSPVAPKYPLWLVMSDVKGSVRVSFVVGLNGQVEDARILESSDSRFDSLALDAMKQFKFLSAEGPNGLAEREMDIQPFDFAGRRRRP